MVSSLPTQSLEHLVFRKNLSELRYGGNPLVSLCVIIAMIAVDAENGFNEVDCGVEIERYRPICEFALS